MGMKEPNRRKQSFLRRFRWGILPASVHLLITVPCAIIYLTHPQEYSIPMFIAVYLSYPVYHVLFVVLRRQTLFIERLSHGETIAVAVTLTVTAIFYFAIGQTLAYILRKVKSSRASSGMRRT